MLTCVSVALTAVAASLRVFGNERIVYWREAATGTSTISYFIGKGIEVSLKFMNFSDMAQIPHMVVAPLIFLTLFYSLTVPRARFLTYYLIFFCLQFSSTALGYFVSTVVKPNVSQLTGVVTVLVMMMFSGE